MGGSRIQTPLDELAGLVTTCHCERETKCDGAPESATCGVESDPYPPDVNIHGIRTLGQEKRQRRSVATMLHRVYQPGNVECYKMLYP